VNHLSQHPIVAWGLRALGVEPQQYFQLLRLFATLSHREEYVMGRTSISRSVFLGLFVLIIAIGNILVIFAGRPPLRLVVLVNVVVSAVLLLTTLAAEAFNTFLNPVEASVLAHQPIQERSYFAAKLTYLLGVVASMVLPLNAIPAVAGLNLKEARWFFPITYLTSVYLLGVFTALLLCAVIGLLFRLIPINRLRSVVASLQAGIFVMLFIVPRIARYVGSLQLNIPPEFASAIPVNWFVSLATIGQGPTIRLGGPAMVAALLSGVLFVYGIQSLTEGYLTNVHTLLHGASKRRRFSRQFLGPLIRVFTRKPSGRAAFYFMYAMARTDWQFRVAVLPALVQFLLLPAFAVARSLGSTPFGAGRPTAAYLLPHSGLAGVTICVMLIYSSQHRATWIFLTAPLEGIRSFVRGIYWAIWMPFGVLSALLLPLYIWRWGVGDALLFTGYSLALLTLYVAVELFLVDGLPFANPPTKGSGFLTAPLILASLLAAGIIVVLQWLFIFQNRLVTFGVSFVFIFAAYLVARMSLRNLETNVLHNLHVIASGRLALFQEIE
jgi:hypothetical protein